MALEKIGGGGIIESDADPITVQSVVAEEADLPDPATTTAGDVAFVAQQDQMYVSDGSAWSPDVVDTFEITIGDVPVSVTPSSGQTRFEREKELWAKPDGLAEDGIVDQIVDSQQASQALVDIEYRIEGAAQSAVAMNKVSASSKAMDAVSASSMAMDAVSASSTARDAVNASQIAFDAVGAVNMAIGKFVAGSAGLTPSNFVDMDEVAASQTAMNAVTASSTAMNAVAASSTAMNAVAASSTAMGEVIASEAALDAVVASQTAMDEVAASQTALDTIAASQTAASSVAASSTAVSAIEGASSVGSNSVPSPNNASIYVAELEGGGGGGGDGFDKFDAGGDGGPGEGTSFHQSSVEGGGPSTDPTDGGGNVSSPDVPINGPVTGGADNGGRGAGRPDGGDGGFVKALIINPDRQSLSLTVGSGGSGGGNDGNNGGDGSATIFTPNVF